MVSSGVRCIINGGGGKQRHGTTPTPQQQQRYNAQAGTAHGTQHITRIAAAQVITTASGSNMRQ